MRRDRGPSRRYLGRSKESLGRLGRRIVLADDDDHVAAVKAGKYAGNGGTEGFRRPIQSRGNCPLGEKGPHWRVFELASLPAVSLAGLIPSPLKAVDLAVQEILSSQIDPDRLPQELESFRRAGRVPDNDLGSLEAAIGQYRDLCRLMNGDATAMAAAFSP